MTRERKMLLQQDQIAELRAEQRAEYLGDKATEYVTANRNPKFQIKAREAKGYVHIWTRINNLAPDQKSFIHEDKVVCIRLREFERMVEQRAFAQYDEYDVIHHPTDTTTKFKLKDDVAGDQPTNRDMKAAFENVAVRERQLAAKESQIDNKLSELDDKSRQLDELIAQAKKNLAAAQTPAPAPTPGPTITAAPVVETKVEPAAPGTAAAEMPNPSPIPPKEEPKAEGAKPDPKADKKK